MFIIRTNFHQINVITMITNYDHSVEINRNPNWSYVPDHPYRILIIGGSGSGENNLLLNLIKHQQPFESKYQLLIYGKKK